MTIASVIGCDFHRGQLRGGWQMANMEFLALFRLLSRFDLGETDVGCLATATAADLDSHSPPDLLLPETINSRVGTPAFDQADNPSAPGKNNSS